MPAHHIGETVTVRPPSGSTAADGAYEITKVQPAEDGAPRTYVAKSAREPYARAITEDWIIARSR